MTDKLRKYVLPNIPYVFIGWVFLKLGTAYRLAAGGDFAHKFIGLGQTVGAAFADFAPGLAPFDWLVGIVGAVAFRLLICFKSKNAKKYRRDEEYGSARWGSEKDIRPFVDPKFENNMILTATEQLTMNTRPQNPANARNLNFCGIGSSGSGKTRFWLTPQLLQAHSSYVVVDPKGGVLGQVGSFLQKQGYKIKVFNSIDFSRSMHYNPLAYIKTEADILIPNIIIRKTKPLGHYGRLRKAYLEMHRPILFNELVLSDRLFEHCAEIDEAAQNRIELIVPQLAKQYGVTERLKAENQMEWVRQMNACKAQAEEIVKAELIYD